MNLLKQQRNSLFLGVHRRPDMKWVSVEADYEGIIKSMSIAPLTLEQRARFMHRNGLMGCYHRRFKKG